MCLFAYRLHGRDKGNQLRLYLSALAYTLVEALRRLALKGTSGERRWIRPAQAVKIGAGRIRHGACG